MGRIQSCFILIAAAACLSGVTPGQRTRKWTTPDWMENTMRNTGTPGVMHFPYR